MKYKFICEKCIDEGLCSDPCILKFKQHIDEERPDWREALARCPFENSNGSKLTGYAPKAEWRQVDR